MQLLLSRWQLRRFVNQRKKEQRDNGQDKLQQVTSSIRFFLVFKQMDVFIFSGFLFLSRLGVKITC